MAVESQISHQSFGETYDATGREFLEGLANGIAVTTAANDIIRKPRSRVDRYLDRLVGLSDAFRLQERREVSALGGTVHVIGSLLDKEDPITLPVDLREGQ